MKFLFIGRSKDSFYALPQDKQGSVIMAAIAFFNKYLKSGQCKEAYTSADFKSTISIWDYDTDEESARIALEYPFRIYEEQEAIALVDFETGAKIFGELINAPKVTKK
jgi:hypothetical protein